MLAAAQPPTAVLSGGTEKEILEKAWRTDSDREPRKAPGHTPQDLACARLYACPGKTWGRVCGGLVALSEQGQGLKAVLSKAVLSNAHLPTQVPLAKVDERHTKHLGKSELTLADH